MVDFLAHFADGTSIYQNGKNLIWGYRDPNSSLFNDARFDHLYYVVFEYDRPITGLDKPRVEAITHTIPPYQSKTVELGYYSNNSAYASGVLSWYKDAGSTAGNHRYYGAYPCGRVVANGRIEFDFYTRSF